MTLHNIKITVLFSLLCVCGLAQGQNNLNSPYSISGVGLLAPNNFMHHRFMGGVNTVVDSIGTFSFSNPATLANTTLTNLEFGASFHNVRQQSGASRNDYNSGSFEYVALALPISLKRNIAVAIGLNPFSRVDYFLQNKALVNGDSVFTTFQGSGGLDELKLAFGMKLFKGLNVGVTSSAVFGIIQNNADKTYYLNKNIYSFNDLTSNYYNGWSHKIGVQYTGRTGSRLYHNLGASYTLGSDINVSRERFIRTYNGSGNFIIDTILRKSDDPIKVGLPSGYSFAYGIGDRGHWFVGLQYNVQNWSTFTDLNKQNNYFNQMDYRLGGYFQAKSYTQFESYAGRKERRQNYLKVARFYYGLSYSNLYMNSFTEQITELGINFGVGFPIMKSAYIDEHKKIGVISRINVGVGYTKRGSTDNGLIQENVFQISVGTNFNDKWFTKRKYQ